MSPYLLKIVKVENLIINATAKTPKIDFNHSTGELVFTGISIPENPAKLYEVALKWVKDYVEKPQLLTNLRLNLEYFNTSSIMWIAKMVKALSSMDKKDATLLIHLYYDIAEFESMDAEDIADTISPFIGVVEAPTISIGIKVYGVDDSGQPLKETIVFV